MANACFLDSAAHTKVKKRTRCAGPRIPICCGILRRLDLEFHKFLVFSLLRDSGSMSEAKKEQITRVLELWKQASPALYGEEMRGMLTSLTKSAAPPIVGESTIDQNYGRLPHPFNFKQIEAIRDYNVDHSSCLTTKVASTTGLGHKNEKVYEVLDPLCNFNWQSVMDGACYDYWEKGVAMIEVVRNGPNGEITGLHHLPVKHTHVFWEGRNLWHYEVDTPATADSRGQHLRKLARFGELDALTARLGDDHKDLLSTSEVILIPSMGNISPFYGHIDWLAGVPTMELVQATTQEEFDFHWNRSVPEFMLFLLGGVEDEVLTQIEDSLRASIGPGNTRKSLVVNLQNSSKETHDIVMHQLGVQGNNESSFANDGVAHSLKIVSAHGVPPLLAGIQVPGKMGAANELPNALAAFQLLRIAPAQKLWSRMLACTLGHAESRLPLSGDDFLQGPPSTAQQIEEELTGKKPGKMNGFHTLVDELDLDSMDTMARMREPIAGSGRDPSQGLKQRGGEDKSK